MKVLLSIFVLFSLVIITTSCGYNKTQNLKCSEDQKLINGVCIDEKLDCEQGFVQYEGKCVYQNDNDDEKEINENKNESNVTVDKNQLYVDGEPFFIKGVCWNPVEKGGVHPADLNFKDAVAKDAKLMSEAGINVVRTYEPIVSTEVLDVLYEYGIYVINTVYPYGGKNVNSVSVYVNDLKDHPAILMWAIGNEWNYNGLYVGDNLTQAKNKINEVASIIKEIDDNHPVTTIYGYLPPKNIVDSMPDIDVWGLNVYGGLNFGDIFNQWKTISDKPMFMAEYGADAWNSITNSLDLEAQAKATRLLTQIIIDNSSIENSENVCLGGTIFEFTDEWWKDNSGSPNKQDNGGIAPGFGPYPDNTFNEEYWGICDIDRNPRPAYYVLKDLFTK